MKKIVNPILPNTLLKIRDIAILIGKISLLYHQFQKNVKRVEDTSSIMVDESVDIKSQEYNEYVNKTVRASDDMNIGKVEAVNKDIFVIKKGFIKLHYYYIPISKVQGWDYKVLRLKIKEIEVKEKYERNKPPDPYRYYVKDYPYYTAGYLPPLAVIKK